MGATFFWLFDWPVFPLSFLKDVLSWLKGGNFHNKQNLYYFLNKCILIELFLEKKIIQNLLEVSKKVL